VSQIVRDIKGLRAQVSAWRAEGLRVALVPTMGALHEGHLSLVDLALQHADRCVMSIFVNPTQFAPNEDFDAYPRQEAAGVAAFEGRGGHLIFAPTPDEIYPEGFVTSIRLEGPALGLEQAFRPTHFDGVALVVAKLLLAAGADVAVFGEKDYQQLQVIRRLVMDLHIPTQIIGAPIVRDDHGLALSSRNAYLDARACEIARKLNRRLLDVVGGIADDPLAAADLMAKAQHNLCADGFDKIDYVSLKSTDLGDWQAGAAGRLLAAVWLGRTRLIDNFAVPAA
jgi:pantoate--beta-alanine ligase